MTRLLQIFTPSGAMRAWATVTMVIVGFGLGLGLTIAYVAKVDREAEARNVQRSREICGIIRLIDDRNQQVKPANAEQKAFIDELHRYRQALGC